MAFSSTRARICHPSTCRLSKPLAESGRLPRASTSLLRKGTALSGHKQHRLGRPKSRQQELVRNRKDLQIKSEVQTDQTKTQTRRPTLTVLDVQLQDGPLAGEMTVQGSLDMEHLDENKVFDLLTDHERSSEIFRAIIDVETAYQPDGSIRLTQNCRWKFLFFSGSFPVELEVVEDRADRSFTFRDVRQGGLMEKMEGQWTVGPSEAIPGGVRVEHRLTVKMAIAAPPPFDAQTNKIFVNQVNDIMTDLQLAMEEKSSTLTGPVVSEVMAASETISASSSSPNMD